MTTTALSYEELADRLGINLTSARRLVLRRRWSKLRGNDGKAIIQVPEDFLQSRDDARDDSHDDGATDDAVTVAPPDPAAVALTDAMARLAAAQDRIVELVEKLGWSEASLAAHCVWLEELRAERDRWAEMVAAQQRESAAISERQQAERAQVEELRAERDRWREEATRPRGLLALFRRRA